MRYDAELFRLSGIDFRHGGGGQRPAPRSSSPPTISRFKRPTPLSPRRSSSRKTRPGCRGGPTSRTWTKSTLTSRRHGRPLSGAGSAEKRDHAADSVLVRQPRRCRAKPAASSKPRREPRPDTFAVSAFRFENVEVLGFRIDLAAFGRDFTRDLARLIEPLNFHLGQSSTHVPVPDFRYRVATPTLLIELLRYNRMRSKDPAPPMRLDDSQSQHELVVRLLVGPRGRRYGAGLRSGGLRSGDFRRQRVVEGARARHARLRQAHGRFLGRTRGHASSACCPMAAARDPCGRKARRTRRTIRCL